MPVKFSSFLPRLQRTALIALLLATSQLHAQEERARFTKPLPPSQSIIIENTNLTTRDFLIAYQGSSVDERRYSELYLLGVLDASEGSIWCDYGTYKTITIDERLFTHFKQLSQKQLNQRAASVIKSILSKEFPCGRGR